MNFEWTTEQQQLYARFAEFGQEVVASRAASHWETGQFDLGSWREMARLGFWKPVIPAPFGGHGSNWWDLIAAAEGLASTCGDGGFVLSLIGQLGVIRALETHGSPEQQQRYFPRLLDGALSATCIAERHSGTDLGGTRTEMSGPVGKGRLNGEKWNISHAPDAEIFLVSGRITGGAEAGLSTFLLDQDMPGIHRGEPDPKMGNRSLPTGSLRFEEIPIGRENLLGRPGRPDALQSGAGLQRIAYGLLGSLLPDPVFVLVKDFLRERHSQGQALSDHQYVQGHLTEALLQREQALWMGRAALGEYLNGNSGSAMLPSMAKLSGSRAGIRIVRELTALLGSAGYLEGLPSRLLRDLLAWTAVGGTEEAHRINIFRQYTRSKPIDPRP